MVSVPTPEGNPTAAQHGLADYKANCLLQFDGDPGNWTMAQCVSEAALALVLDRKDLPPRGNSTKHDGFGTPAELLGSALLKRLTNTKIRPAQCVTHVRKHVPQHEWRMYP